ncbi:MAG: M48 family metalloprotease [bacterium]|nr:M48 family metalloprotease [bacterium]
MMLIFAAIGLRFLRPQLMFSLFAATSALQIGVYAYSAHIVKTITRCEQPNPEILVRLNRLLDELMKEVGRMRRPSLWVSRSMEVPNAFAFGRGFGTSSHVAVTQPLLDLLDDRELKAVLGHELGHLRSYDVATMTLVSVLIGFMSRIAQQAFRIGKMGIAVSFLLEVILYLPRIVASGISQLREFAADAHAALITGETESLINAFRKFETWYKEHPDEIKKKTIRGAVVDELLLSHPDMEQRIQFLNELSLPCHQETP